MTATREIIDPTKARRLLESNHGNRKIVLGHVKALANQMTRGEWRYNPLDPIGIAYNGRLINGQNRLLAIIESGTEQPFSIERGLDPELFQVIDQGRKRSGADYLYTRDEKNTSELSSILGWQFRHEMAGRPYRLDSRVRPTNYQIDELLGRLPELRASVGAGARFMEPTTLLPKSVANWMHFRFSKVSPEKADSFWSGVGKGIGLAEDDPRYVFRKLLLRRAAGGTVSRSSEVVIACAIKAWNAFMEGKIVKVISWKEGESFPAMIGD